LATARRALAGIGIAGLAAVWLVVCPVAAVADVLAVRALLDAGRYTEAEAAASAVVEAAVGRPQPEQVAARQLLVDALIRNGRGGEPRTLALARALLPRTGRDHMSHEQGLSLRLLGQALFESADFAQSAATFNRALRIHEALGSSDDVADDLDGYALANIWRWQYDVALATLDRSLAMRAVSEPGGGPGTARTLTIRGVLNERRSQLDAARADAAAAVEMRQRTGPDHPETVAPLTLYGLQLRRDADKQPALDILERAVALARRLLRPGHPEIARTLRALAEPTELVGTYTRARALREEALRIAEDAYGGDHPLVARCANDLAMSLGREGDFAGARRLQQRALAINESHLGVADSYVATNLNNQAIDVLEIGDYDEGVRLATRALRIWERVEGPNHRFVAYALIGLAYGQEHLGRYRAAVTNLERALRIREREYGRDHEALGYVVVPLGRLYFRLGARVRARALAEQGRTIWEKAQNPDELSDALMLVGRIAFADGHAEDASRAYQRALAIRLVANGPTHPDTAETRAALAATLLALGRTNEALAAAMAAEEIGRSHLRLTLESLSERQGLAYAAARPKGLDVALSMASEPATLPPIVDAIVRGRAIVLDAIGTRRRFAGSSPELASLWRATTETTQRLADLAVAPPTTDTARHAARIEAAQRQKETAETALAERSAAFGADLARRDIGLDAVLAAIPARTALVSVVRYDRTPTAPIEPGTPPPQSKAAYAAVILRGGSADPVLVQAGDAATVDGLVTAWRRAVVHDVAAAAAPTSAHDRTLRRIGTALRERVWDPVAAHLDGIDQVFVVPDGTLNLLPIAALPAGDGRYLVEVGPTIHYLSAERDLVVPSTDRPESRSKGLLAIGGPAYGPTPSTVRSGPAAPARQVPTCGTFDAMEFHPLPAARREAEDVAAMWRVTDPNAEVLTGARASEAVFKREAPGRRYLHLATHGFFLGNDCEDAVYAGRGPDGLRGIGGRKGPKRQRLLPDSPLLLSGLALAGANQRRPTRANPEDGILTAEEVSALDLDGVEWAVLSACDTGVGEIKAGEGVFGLRRAFRVAGARTIIMSLWAVEDRSARAWMRPLYEGRLRDHLSTADAVRHASLTVLAERRAKGLSTHPFYWAGFVAAGDWR
jgi:CHAT domain-containing protein/tetratricopeptide (TPR) repeat protein